MTIRQRFLLLFSYYRNALERAQRAEDEALRQRSIAEETQKRIDQLTQDSIQREREISDRMMRTRFGDRIAFTPEQIAEQIGQAKPRERRPEPVDVRTWRQNRTAAALESLEQFSQKVNGG